MKDSDISRFWKHVDKSGRCWLWTGGMRDGYGRFKIGGRKYKLYQAHRVSWMIENGPIPGGLLVLHNCPDGDNRACVRPSHLWLGTVGDNNSDRHRKGRDAKGARNGRYTCPDKTAIGERNGKSKLTAEQAAQIFSFYFNQAATGPELAHLFSMGITAVYNVIHRKTWKSATRHLW